MNSMNNWIEHLHHPLVFAGFGLFLLALLLRPLFLNNKKLTGTATERLLSKEMILVFILALLAIIGGVALSWKATPTAKADSEQAQGLKIKLTLQQHEERLKKMEKQLLAKQASGTVTDEKDRHLLAEELQAVQEKLANLQQSYEEELQRRKNAEKALVKMEGQLSSTQIAEAEKSLAQEDTQKAEQVFDEVVDRQGKFVALAAFQSGKLAEGRVDYAKAMRQYTKAVTLEEDNPEYLLAAGEMALTTATYSKAEDWFKRLLAIIEKTGEEENDELGTALNNLAVLYYTQGQYDKAEPLYKGGLEISEKDLGKDHPSVATSLNNLAELYQQQGRYDEAEPLFKRSLEIREKKLGKDHPSVATSLNNLAELYRQQGRYDEAKPLFKRSLEIWEKSFGKDHPSVATSLNNLAGLYYTQSQYNKAELLLKRALEILKKALGKDHPNVATILHNLAMLYDTQDRYDEAEPLYQRCLSILHAVFPDGHPNIKVIQDNYDNLKKKMAQKQIPTPSPREN